MNVSEPIDQTATPGKVFKEKSIPTASMIGGPIAAGYILAENFKALGQSHKVVPTWILSILTTIAIFVLVFTIPEDVNIPNMLIPLTYTGIAYIIFRSTQTEKVNKHLEDGGKAHSWGRVIAVSLIGLLISATAVFGIVLIDDGIPVVARQAPVEEAPVERSSIKTENYGESGSHQIDFDSRNISKEEIDQIASALEKAKLHEIEDASYIYVVKQKDSYACYVSVLEGTQNDEKIAQRFQQLRDKADQLIPNKKLVLHLSVDNIQNVVKTFD
jgi:hypothetical protein